MSGVTHLAVGLVSVAPFIKNEPKMLSILPFAVLGALIPDIEADYSLIKTYKFIMWFSFLAIAVIILGNSIISIIGIIAFVILVYILRQSEHRTVTHSLLGLTLFSLCILLAAKSLALYFVIGYSTHLILDMVSKRGIALLYPYNKKVKFNIIDEDKNIELALLISSLLGALYIIFIG